MIEGHRKPLSLVAVTNVRLNEFGRIVDEELKKSQIIRKEIILDQYVIMPNHVHSIIVIDRGNTINTVVSGNNNNAGTKEAGGQPAAPAKKSLSSFVNGFKSSVTTRINTLRNMPGEPVWQRSFHDHIIRNERSLNTIRKYIADNPVNWEQDIGNLLNL